MYMREAGHWRHRNLRRTKLYNTWCRMRHRCLGVSKDARYYRDRGITICAEWRDNYDAFRAWAVPAAA